jgi:hypothetical protein
MKCSSDYNGCTNCGPAFSIFYKSVSVPISLYGFAPFQDDENVRYLSQMKDGFYSEREVTVLAECCVRPFGPQGFTCAGAAVGTRYTYINRKGNSNEIWSHIIGECGNVIADYTLDGFGDEVRQFWIPNDEDDECRNYSANVKASKDFGGTIKYNYGGTCTYPSLPAGGSVIFSSTIMKTIVADADSSQDNCMVSSSTYNLSELGTTTLSGGEKLSYFQDITSEAASKAMIGKNSEDNNNPCISYAAWSLAVPETTWNTGNKDSEINALKIRIAIPKDNFKEYSSIGGTYYLYYGGAAGETPCCQSCGGPECFTGTIVQASNFSLGESTDTELEGYFVASALQINNYSNNLPVNQNLKFCYTIDNIEPK